MIRTAPRGKLLVVDDDDAFRESMELEFTDRGYTVITAPDHRTALGMAAVHKPQYGVIDMRLEGERGLEVLVDLVERLPGMRCVVLTGYGSIATAVEAIKLGAIHYLTKPADPDAIEKAFDHLEGDPTIAVPDAPPSLARHEREYIEYVLAATGGNISEAARRLGLHRQSLQRKLRKYPPRR
jgi:two-component system response regulator RegA